MIHSHKVRDKSGEATIWITEKVTDDPDGDTAPYTERVVWAVNRWNVKRVSVSVQEYARMFNGASNRYGTNPAEHVPDDHLKAMKSELQLELCDSEREQAIHFSDYDTELTTGGQE